MRILLHMLQYNWNAEECAFCLRDENTLSIYLRFAHTAVELCVISDGTTTSRNRTVTEILYFVGNKLRISSHSPFASICILCITYFAMFYQLPYSMMCSSVAVYHCGLRKYLLPLND